MGALSAAVASSTAKQQSLRYYFTTLRLAASILFLALPAQPG
jgi:hypothetical protein